MKSYAVQTSSLNGLLINLKKLFFFLFRPQCVKKRAIALSIKAARQLSAIGNPPKDCVPSPKSTFTRELKPCHLLKPFVSKSIEP
jgi:hypothetical protein